MYFSSFTLRIKIGQDCSFLDESTSKPKKKSKKEKKDKKHKKKKNKKMKKVFA